MAYWWQLIVNSLAGWLQQGGFQVKDQTLTRGNLALKKNHDTSTPVRVVRGIIDPATAARSYVYDGLHTVTKWCHLLQ